MTIDKPYQGRLERYEVVDGYLEMFLGYVHTCRSPAERDAAWLDTINRFSPYLTQGTIEKLRDLEGP